MEKYIGVHLSNLKEKRAKTNEKREKMRQEKLKTEAALKKSHEMKKIEDDRIRALV